MSTPPAPSSASPPGRRVLVTDRAWSDLEIERAALAAVGAVPFDAPGTGEAGLAAAAAEAEAILTCWAPVPASVLDAAERCAVVCRFGVGLDNIDVERATELGMVVTNVPAYCDDEVAEHALALIFALARRIVAFGAQTSSGRWSATGAGRIQRLRGRTLGIVGLGSVGSALASRASGLGMETIAHTTGDPGRASELGVQLVESLDELLASADVVSLHLPLKPATQGLIGARELALMKPDALLINTARGGLVDTAALATALGVGELGGAGLDVLPDEPPDLDDPLLHSDRAIVTPHAAFYSEQSLHELRSRTAAAAAAVLDGRIPPDVVNPAVLDRARARLAPS